MTDILENVKFLHNHDDAAASDTDRAMIIPRLSLSESLFLHLCLDFKIPRHNCSRSGVEVPFEAFVQAG